MKTGVKKRMMNIAIKLPYSVQRTASCPFPFRRSSCPGKTESPVSSSGLPRKILGMKSRKVWVIAIAIIKIISVKGSSLSNKGEDINRAETKLICIPGVRPVRVPAKTPKRRAKNNSIILLYLKRYLN